MYNTSPEKKKSLKKMAAAFESLACLWRSRSLSSRGVLVFEDGSVVGGVELAAAVARLREALRRSGVCAGHSVRYDASCSGGVEVAALLACLELKAVWCPTTTENQPRIRSEESDREVVELWRDTRCCVVAPPPQEEDKGFPEDALYVIGTSGTSSGEAVGVVGSASATLNRLRWQWSRFPFSEDDRFVLRRTPVLFVDSIAEILGTVLSDIGQLCIVKELSHMPEKVTRMTLTPSIVECFLATKKFSLSTKLVFCSGEPLSRRLRLRFSKALPSTTLVNVYGSSETAADASYCVLEPPEKRDHCCDLCLEKIESPIGKSFIGSLELNRKKIRVRGPSALGYYARGKISDRKPGKEEPTFLGDSVVDTGDLGSQCKCGSFSCLGRDDDDVNVLGVRVNLRDLEARYGGVAVYEDDKVLLYQTAEDDSISVLPSFVVRWKIDSLPTGPTGKANRRFSKDHAFVSDLFDELLGVSDSTESFRDRGGNSLLAIQMVHHLQEKLKIDVKIADLMDSTVDDLIGAFFYSKKKRRIREDVEKNILEEEETTTVRLERCWSTNLGKCVDAPPLAVEEEDTVYVGSHSKRFAAIDGETGQIKWETLIGSMGDQRHVKEDASIEAGASLHKDKVYVGAYDGVFYCLRRCDGEILWTHGPIGAPIKNAGVIYENTVIFGAHDQRVRCLDCDTGQRLWISGDLGGAVFGTPVVSNLCFCATTKGDVFALAQNYGISVWHFRATAPVFAPLSLAGKHLYFGAVDGTHAALGVDGRSLWCVVARKKNAGVFAKAVLLEEKDIVVFAANDGAIVARSRRTGSMVWHFQARAAVFARPALLSSLLLIATTTGHLDVLNAADGAHRASFSLGAQVYSSPAVLFSKERARIFIGARDDTVSALDVIFTRN